MIQAVAAAAGGKRLVWYLEQASNWCARVLGILLVGLCLLFLIGEGPPPLGRVPPHIAFMFVAQIICLVGFIALWRWRLGGGIVSLAGIAVFYALDYAASGRFPGGWVFPLFFLPGLLAITSWTLGKSQGTKAIS